MKNKVSMNASFRMSPEQAEKLSITQLKGHFFLQQIQLRRAFQKKQARTIEELEFERKFKTFINIPILNSLFIGPHQVDFYLPSLGTYIEIDGGIHYKERVMKMDEYKMKSLGLLGLRPLHFMNFKVMAHFKQVIFSINMLPRLSKKEQKELLLMIYFHTLTGCYPDKKWLRIKHKEANR